MPSYVIARSLGKTGETIEATMCDPTATGYPDRRTDVPVRVKLVSERVLSIDGDPCQIVWSESGNGVVTVLVNGSTRGLRNRELRVALARAAGLLHQLTSILMPLRAESDDPEYVAESLQVLFEWIVRERERATTIPVHQKGPP